MSTELSMGAQALSELRRIDEENGIDPRAFTAVPSPPPPPAPPGIREIMAQDPPDWEAERIDRERQRRAELARQAAAYLAEIGHAEEPPEKPTPPAPRRWRAAQVRGDQP